MRVLRILADCWRYAWCSPCTAVGLCLAAPALLAGARARVVLGVVEIALAEREPGRWVRLLPFTAITFGHAVIGSSRAELDRLRVHEHEHVRQYEKWGIVFFAAYPLESLWQLLRGRRLYYDNRFEVQARAKEGRQR